MRPAFNNKEIVMRSMLMVITLTFLVSCSTHSNPREYQIGAYLWQQTSGEYRALVYQAYNIARERVERDLLDKHNRKRAVIFDIDETLFDNSVGGAQDIVQSKPWKENEFNDWVQLRQSAAIPGTLDFVKFLVDHQVTVFYISNRPLSTFDATYDNLTKLGFPVKKENLLLKGDEHSKESRRQFVLKKYDVIVYLGDNLTDFPGGFENKSVADRNALTDQLKSDFGEKLIILPNPLYGDWERALPTDKSRLELLRIKP
jgi:5'-nucleotidase (lipoprotein e(P4) family)